MIHSSRLGVVEVKREPDPETDPRKRDERDWLWRATPARPRSRHELCLSGAEHSQAAALAAGYEAMSFTVHQDKNGPRTRGEAVIRLHSKTTLAEFGQ